jgi:hypothetical protein
MRRILTEFISHDSQRYPTCGDYIFESNGDIRIWVSDTGNDDYNFLVAVHELIEAYLTLRRGIKEEDITAFDKEFERNREEDNVDEPGDDPDAPYRKEHFFATNVERLLAAELNVDWATYDKTINEL